MKKNKRSLFTLPLAAFIIIGFSAFSPGPTGPVKLDASSKFISDDKGSSTLGTTVSTILLNGCPSACTSIWQVDILNISISWGTVHFNTLSHTFTGTGTPPWTTYSYLGTLTPPYRPTLTQNFTGYDPAGRPIQCTIYPSGDWYIQHTGTSLPMGNSCIFSGSYAK